MSLIAAQLKRVRETVTVKLDKTTIEQLKLYAEFIDSPQEHVVNEALTMTFKKDSDFQAWMSRKEVSSTNGTAS